MFELEPPPAGVRLLTNPEVERLQARYRDLLPRSPDECPTCRLPAWPKPGRATGEFVWWNPDRTGYGHWKCNCVDQWTLNRYFLNAGIEVAYQRLGWADVTHVDPAIVATVQEYLVNAEGYVRAGYGLILHGRQGNGKTMLATLVLKHLLGEGYSGYFTTFADLIAVFTQTWRKDEERAWFDQCIRNVAFLVVDDPGREYGGAIGAGIAGAAFDAVLRHRVAASLPTIVTTNLDPEKFEESYGGNIIGLLSEKSVGVPFSSESFRKEHKARTKQEIDLGLVRPVVVG